MLTQTRARGFRPRFAGRAAPDRRHGVAAPREDQFHWYDAPQDPLEPLTWPKWLGTIILGAGISALGSRPMARRF